MYSVNFIPAKDIIDLFRDALKLSFGCVSSGNFLTQYGWHRRTRSWYEILQQR